MISEPMAGQMPSELARPQECERPYTISEVNAGVAARIEQENTLIWAEGEISNCKQASSGHWYLTLKDASSQIQAVIWRSTAAKLDTMPENGTEVAVIATLKVYQRGGSYQLDIHRLQDSRIGKLYAAFEKLKQKLSDEGLFDASHKKPLPDTIARVGIITSITGAAVRDIISVGRSRAPQIDIIVSDVPVQGDKAPIAIARALHEMNSWGKVDCIILGRGGGSIEDLWAFNTEEVARAIFASEIPVIAAIGHEVDVTIADFVADLRAPTPSAAAEMIFPDTQDRTRYLAQCANHFVSLSTAYFNSIRQTVDLAAERLRHASPIESFLAAGALKKQLAEKLLFQFSHRVTAARSRVNTASAQLHALSPLAVLGRGYAIITNQEGKAIGSIGQMVAGEAINVRLKDGQAQATVTECSIFS